MKTILALVIALVILFSVSCANLPPVKVGYQGKYGTYNYSPEGVEIQINPAK